MKKRMPVAALSMLFLISCSSTKWNIGNYFNRQQTNAVEATGKEFVDLLDGRRVYGNKVDIGGNFRTLVIVDKVKYELNNVKDVQLNNKFYTKINNKLLLTIVRGEKINVYEYGKELYSNNTMTTSSSYFYSKNGGKLIPLYSLKDVARAIGDCSATESINNLTKESLQENMRKDHRFLNECFEKYNKECP